MCFTKIKFCHFLWGGQHTENARMFCVMIMFVICVLYFCKMGAMMLLVHRQKKPRQKKFLLKSLHLEAAITQQLRQLFFFFLFCDLNSFFFFSFCDKKLRMIRLEKAHAPAITSGDTFVMRGNGRHQSLWCWRVEEIYKWAQQYVEVLLHEPPFHNCNVHS